MDNNAHKMLENRPVTDALPPRTRSASGPLAPAQRSSVTNGRKSFLTGDHNAAWTRRWRDLVLAHEQDLGGADVLSEAQSSLVRRVATIEIELEQREGMLSKGEPVDLDAYTRAASHLRRILESLGLKRVAKPIPTLAEHLAAVARERSPFSDEDDDATLDALPAGAENAK